jgi:hypothetical protein
MPRTFLCAQCGGTFEGSDELLARFTDEALARTPLVLVCDACYREIFSWIKQRYQPSVLERFLARWMRKDSIREPKE